MKFPQSQLPGLPNGGNTLPLLFFLVSLLAALLTQSQFHGTSLPRTSYPATLLSLPPPGLISLSAARVVSLISSALGRGSATTVRYGEGAEVLGKG